MLSKQIPPTRKSVDFPEKAVRLIMAGTSGTSSAGIPSSGY